jgi:siderophore synthetase component
VPDVAAQPATLPDARAAVLARLWGALVREPIEGLSVRGRVGEQIVAKLPDGRSLRGDHAAAELFASVAAGWMVELDGVGYDDAGRLLRDLGLPGPTARLADELDNSVANLALARAGFTVDGGAPLLARAAAAPDPLAYLEQSIVDGHPIHPGCRTRIGLSPAEVLAYAPEHHAVVDLVELAVAPQRWLGIDCPPRLLAHPWQVAHRLEGYAGLRDTGRRVPARPLMSLRTLAQVENPTEHVKTAVDVQMTSAPRTVSPAAIHNGPLLSRLLATMRVPGLEILPEVAGGAVLVDGEPSRNLAMLRRRVPALAPAELALPLAALAAPSPVDGRPLLVECVGVGDPLAYVRRLVAVVGPPLIRLLALGVALEAHGQNLLLVVRDAQPVRLLYRDFGGVRVSPARLRRHGIDPPPLRGDVVSDDPDELRTKLFAAVMSTVVGEVVALIVRWFGVPAEHAWRSVRTTITSTMDSAEADVAALLRDPWPVKATTAMRLAADPLTDRWVSQPNPLESL